MVDDPTTETLQIFGVQLPETLAAPLVVQVYVGDPEYPVWQGLDIAVADAA